MICTSFYHMTKIDENLTSLSGRFSNFYPSDIFKEKLARDYIDVECAKRMIIWLSGDKSGIGNIMKGKLNKNWLDFVLKFDNRYTQDVYEDYYNLVKSNFDTKFIVLNL